MVAEQQAPNADTETFESSPLGGSASAGPAGGAAMDRLAGLDVRAQSALLQEAFEKSDPSELDTPTPAVLPKRSSLLARFGWRALKSAFGLGVVPLPGVSGPAPI